jgi:rhamnosyltransferase
MQISLVIPTWNGMPELEDVLAAVDRQPGAGALERVAVDSGSRDGTRECLARHGFTVHAIAQREFNHGATRDFAIERTRGEVIVLLTQDAKPADERWLPALVEAFARPRVGAAYCRQIPRPDCNPFIARRLREWTAGRSEPVEQRLSEPGELERLAPLERLQRCAYDNVAGAVRRATWDKLRFGWRRFGEDIAFGKRVLLGGESICYEPQSAVVHSHNRTPRAEGKRIYCDHQNLRELFDILLLPTWRDCRNAIAHARKDHARIVDELGLPAAERAALHRWARGYARWATLGMYLGANSRRLQRGALGFAFRWIDRWMHAGI